MDAGVVSAGDELSGSMSMLSAFDLPRFEVETRVQHEKGRSALNVIESTRSRGRAHGRSVSRSCPPSSARASRARLRVRAQSPAPPPPPPSGPPTPTEPITRAAGRGHALPGRGFKEESVRSGSEPAEPAHTHAHRSAEARARGRVTLRKCALGQVGRAGETQVTPAQVKLFSSVQRGSGDRGYSIDTISRFTVFRSVYLCSFMLLILIPAGSREDVHVTGSR
ncbi:hypothetical protein F2P79_015257 [Pimephales promelas]|nr:hypothetical protein F2P79_015257 [Pimephales promelas]